MADSRDTIAALMDLATDRIDQMADRLRVLELAEARREGAASSWARVQPWITTILSLGAFAAALLKA